MSVTVKVHGLAGVADSIKRWELRARGRALVKAVKAAGTPIRDAAASNVPKKGGKGSTGALRASISLITRTKRGSRGSVVTGVIGPATKSSMPRTDTKKVPGHVSVDMKTGNPIYRKAKTLVNIRRRKGKLRGKIQVNTPTRYAHLVEFGFIHVRGKTKTQVKPRPFMRPAWHSQGGQKAVDRFADSLRKTVLES